MAEEESGDAAPAEGGADEELDLPKPSKVPLIVALLNTVVILGALGAVVYTQMLFKRPPITETQERERLVTEKAAKDLELVPGFVELQPFTVNIGTRKPKNPDDHSYKKRADQMHYAAVKLTLKLRDETKKESIEKIRARLMDKVVAQISAKTFYQLTHVQGRYILRTEILDIANELIKENLVIDVFFTEFIVQ